jgi:hypothetical protein
MNEFSRVFYFSDEDQTYIWTDGLVGPVHDVIHSSPNKIKFLNQLETEIKETVFGMCLM